MRGSILLLCLLALTSQVGRARGAGAPTSPSEVVPLAVGATVPEVMLSTIEGAPFALAPAIVKHPVVLIFYRGGW